MIVFVVLVVVVFVVVERWHSLTLRRFKQPS